MKKIKNQTMNLDLKMPKLTKNDILEIERVILQEIHAEGYKLTVGEYRYDNVAEVDQDMSRDVSISTDKPSIQIDFTPVRSSIRVSNKNDIEFGNLNALLEVLRRSERKVRYRLLYSQGWNAPLIALITVLVIPSLLTRHLSPIFIKFLDIQPDMVDLFTSLASALLGILLLISYMAISYYLSIYRYSLVFFRDRPNLMHELKKNRWSYILNAFIALIFFLLGLVISCN